MSIEVDTEADAEAEAEGTTDDLESLAEKLGKAIADTPEHQAFEEAQSAVKASDDAQERIQDFEQRRQEFMLARQTGEATREDLMAVQTAQQELHDIPVMAEYLEAQAALENRLESVNLALSEPLGVDFGELAGGCCQDE